MNKIISLYFGKIEKYRMLKNLSLVILSVLDIFEIDITTEINFAKIHKGSEVVLSMTLFFGRILSLVKRFL